MASRTAPHRALVAAISIFALGAGLSVTAVAAEPAPPTDDQIIQAKCTLCHGGHRVYRLKPEEIKPVLERMRKLNPDLISLAESDHVAEVIARILNDPNALAERTAWADSVERGKNLFSDASLGTTGKSCSSCHQPAAFKNAVEEFPRYSPKLKRFVDLQEWINMMITEQMKGTALPAYDQRYLDLFMYLKSLK